MGNSTYTSNLKGVSGVTISGFDSISATILSTDVVMANDTIVAPILSAETYITMGDDQYIFFGAANTEATIVANATSVNASNAGSMTLSKSAIWFHDGDDTATRVTLY